MIKHIWYLFLILLVVAGISACATRVRPQVTTPVPPLFKHTNSSMMFNDSGTTWQYVGSHKDNGSRIRTFIPVGENKYRWTRQVTIAYYKNKPPQTVSAYRYYLTPILAEFNEQCYGSTSDVHLVRESSAEVIYIYQMFNCGKKANQAVAGKVVQTRHGVSSIAYTVKTDHLITEQVDKMLGLVTNAQVIKD